MAKMSDPTVDGALDHIFHRNGCPFHRAHVISIAGPTCPLLRLAP